jgi:acetylornithine deacetylase/succinyl-diaminopimelate desuccinylase-like protein
MNIPDPIQLTQDLIRFNTINPPGNEDELCNYLTGLLESAGFECMNVDFAPKRRHEPFSGEIHIGRDWHINGSYREVHAR